MVKTKAIFLTRGEIHIHSINRLSIYLKCDDRRWEEIHELMTDDILRFAMINPKADNYRILSDTWYLIQHLEYVDSDDVGNGYIQVAFKYKFDSPYVPSNRTRVMTKTEIESFKKDLCF